MGFLKIIGYITCGMATGIVTVIALPIAGSIGVITAAGALIAGSSGAVIGGVVAVTDTSEEDAKNKGYQEGILIEKANSSERINRLLESLRRHEEHFKELKAFEEYAIAMFAVAFSVTNCDGEMLPIEVQEIEEFITGELYTKLPISLQSEIQRMKTNPPSFNTAMEYVKKVDVGTWDIFDNIIELAMYADGITRSEETAYLAAWKQFKNAA